eukprot:CAMPEP_0181295284 /NCGR_PEP_ID=MMETSP1101-20121128/4062_1 /TAXON_ID=46948 /ORGANISM="Rhodomonas abbreviata, Strain Caron Lab Isolate" /LENGTH=50 /DNA_ID=CAMNT_0023400019 /DNA_START=62 /DNA_END=214 /DNA_ORIENTATION=+
MLDCPHANPDLGYNGTYDINYNPLGADPTDAGDEYKTSWSAKYTVNSCNS